MSRKTDQELEKYLRGDSPLSRAYRVGRDEQPPELLDARIRREARALLGSGRASRPWLTRWAPLAAAAVIVMSISVVLFRFDRAESPLPSGGDVATTPMAETFRRAAEPPAKDAHKAAPAPFPAGRVDTRMKKNCTMHRQRCRHRRWQPKLWHRPPGLARCRPRLLPPRPT